MQNSLYEEHNSQLESRQKKTFTNLANTVLSTTSIYEDYQLSNTNTSFNKNIANSELKINEE